MLFFFAKTSNYHGHVHDISHAIHRPTFDAKMRRDVWDHGHPLECLGSAPHLQVPSQEEARNNIQRYVKYATYKIFEVFDWNCNIFILNIITYYILKSRFFGWFLFIEFIVVSLSSVWSDSTI